MLRCTGIRKSKLIAHAADNVDGADADADADVVDVDDAYGFDAERSDSAH